MISWNAALVALAAAVLLWAVAVAALLVTGRRSHARALAGLVPDCAVLLHRLLRDGRLSAGGRLAVLAMLGYLALPIDLVLRYVLRSAGAESIRELWPGPPESLAGVMRLAS